MGISLPQRILRGNYNRNESEAKIFTDMVDSASIAQIQKLCNQEFTAGSRFGKGRLELQKLESHHPQLCRYWLYDPAQKYCVRQGRRTAAYPKQYAGREPSLRWQGRRRLNNCGRDGIYLYVDTVSRQIEDAIGESEKFV